MWSARGKHKHMPPKPWPTSYLFKIRHDLVHSGRLPTCKQHNPQAVIYHTTCTQSISIINYIFIHIILKGIQRYRLSIKFLYDIWYYNIHLSSVMIIYNSFHFIITSKPLIQHHTLTSIHIAYTHLISIISPFTSIWYFNHSHPHGLN